MYNEDIYNHTGYFEIDDYIGNAERSGYTEQNEELDYVRERVFKKYSSKNLINNTIDILGINMIWCLNKSDAMFL